MKRVLKIILLLSFGAFIAPLMAWMGWILEGWFESRDRYEGFNRRLNDLLGAIHTSTDQLWRGHF